MKIFNSIKFGENNKDENLLLLYEQKIEERKQELLKFDDILKSKRKEIARVEEERKLLVNESKKLETEKIELELELEKVRANIELLHTMEIEEREVALSINSQISLLKNEANEKYLLQNDIEKMKSEYDVLTDQIKESQNRLKALKHEEDYLTQVKKEISLSIEKFQSVEEEISLADERLKILLDREKKLESKSFKQLYNNLVLNKIKNSNKISLTKKAKNTPRCTAITKKGERCCRKSLPNRKLCSIHSK